MTDIFIQIGLSNVCISLALAIVAMVVQMTVRRAHLSYLLWLIVLAKLVTLPVMTIPVAEMPGLPDSSAVAIENHYKPDPAIGTTLAIDTGQQEFGVTSNISTSAKTWFAIWDYGKAWLPTIWLSGIVAVFAWSMVRIFRFNRLLTIGSVVAPQKLQTMSSEIASRLGIKTVPVIHTSSANISPLVWWIGGKVRIVVPSVLLEKMDPRQYQWILAHELAHVRRLDYLVRWIEWLACVCFWWNPVVWWARRNLRGNEEICCDALVVSSLKPEAHFYANSLLTAIESLACPGLRSPAIASEINGGGFLERRFKMIVSENLNKKNSRWLKTSVLLCAIVVLSLGVAFAQDKTEAYLGQVWEKLQAEVEAGNITAEEAEAKMTAIEEQLAERTKTGAYLEQVWEKLQAQIEAGSLTADDAETMMEAIKKKYYANAETEAYFKQVWAKLQAEVEAGNMTAEEAEAKMVYIKKQKFDAGDKVDVYFKEVWAKLQVEVEAGNMTREDAEAKMAAIKKAKLGDKANMPSREEMGQVKERIWSAVKAGDITEAQAEERWEGYLKRFRQNECDEIDWDSIKRRIEGAVERGDMPREEADAKYIEIKKQMSR
jgi:beta-lactamase regulating signal transducer with metallopeptidase domain